MLLQITKYKTSGGVVMEITEKTNLAEVTWEEGYNKYLAYQKGEITREELEKYINNTWNNDFIGQGYE